MPYTVNSRSDPFYLLAYLLDWHTREDKSTWWEYFRLLEVPEAELIDEPAAVAGLTFMAEVGTEKKSAICRYTYPPQEIEIRRGDELKLQSKDSWGKVREHDRAARTLDVVVGPSRRAARPTSAFVHSYVNPAAVQDSIERIANEALVRLEDGSARRPTVAWNLLSRTPPLALSAPRLVYESTTDFAERIVHELDGDVLAIQGPPGTGKTYTGARMICALLAAGKRVGVTATSHKVIRNLLDAVRAQSPDAAIAQRASESDAADDSAIALFADNADAEAWIAEQGGRVLGGTAWLWSRKESVDAVDVLFIDEAGQMSLANALAVSSAARSLVLLGDPQQLEQPQKGSHPDGIGVSALDHILSGHQTMPAEQGLFLPITWRLAPAICRYTSEMFYEGKLESKPGLERQRLVTRGRFDGAGLFYVPADHDGCRSASDEEVVVVADIVAELLAPGSMWMDEHGMERQLLPADLRVVAPYNAQVSRLQEHLGGSLPIGTVDKFQGQEAPVVVYSMTTSRPEDAPRGLEFLYSPNRLNVATSRAKCVAILVASPRLFEPDCRTPRQMQLANALCRYRELTSRD